MGNKIDLSKYDQSWYSRGKPGWYVMLWWFVQAVLFKGSFHNMYGFRNFLLRCFGAKIGKNVKVRPTAVITYPWKVEIGDNSWIGDGVWLYSLDKIVIGSNVVISQKSFVCTGNHNYSDPYFGLITKPIIIKDGAWVAADVFVAPGVTIGENTVIVARSSVFENMPDNMICMGYPCKPIKRREIRSE